MATKRTSAPGDESAMVAVLYARVSSKEQEREGYSIPAQQELLRAYAQAHGLTIVREFVDIETAKQAGRTGFGEMLKFLGRRGNNCNTVLVEKTDRLYRNIRDWVTIDDFDLEIHFVKENVVISSSSRSSEKFMHGIKVLMAKNYIDNLSEETRKGMYEKARQGIWPSLAPLGYLNVQRADGRRVIEPDPECAPLIVRLFGLYATGNYSLSEVTKVARQEGLVSRKRGQRLPKSAVHKILMNRLYTGEFEWKGDTYQGIHTALIDRDLFEQVQAVLANKRLRPLQSRKHQFAFSGLLTCGHCGCGLVAQRQKERYVYYHCSGHRGKCPEPYVREHVIAEQFAGLLGQLVFDPEVFAWVTTALKESVQDERADHHSAIARLQAEYTRLDTRVHAMYDDKLDGLITQAYFEEKSAACRSEQARIRADIARHESADQSYLDEGVRLLELAQRAPALFRQQEAEEQKKLLGFVFSNCSWADGKLAAEYRKPFDLLAFATEEARVHKTLPGTQEGISEIMGA